jgi:hypothetical protein
MRRRPVNAAMLISATRGAPLLGYVRGRAGDRVRVLVKVSQALADPERASPAARRPAGRHPGHAVQLGERGHLDRLGYAVSIGVACAWPAVPAGLAVLRTAAGL